MAQERYSEAVLLFDALINLEPRYRSRPRRLVVVAMKDLEKQDALAQTITPPVLKRPEGDTFLDEHEIADLLKQGEEAEAQAKAAGPEAETNTLAPYIPTDAVEPQP